MEQIFEKINTLFYEYLKTLNLENTESAKMSIEQKISIEVWKSNPAYREYAVEVIETARESLKYFPNSEAFKKGVPFSKYLFASLGNSISTSEEKEALANKNGGLYISDDKYRRVKKVKKFFEDVRKMYPDQNFDDDSLIEKAEEFLGMEENEIRECLKMSKAATTGGDLENEEGDKISVFDTMLEGDDTNPLESGLVAKEQLESVLRAIQKMWEKKPDPMLSELLTVEILRANLDIENMEEYTFLDKEICKACLADLERKLPEDSEIAEKYGMTKSAASKKLYRIRESLKKQYR